jgi:hypothetical protein
LSSVRVFTCRTIQQEDSDEKLLETLLYDPFLELGQPEENGIVEISTSAYYADRIEVSPSSITSKNVLEQAEDRPC